MLFGIDSLYFWLAVIIISIAAEAATLGLCGIWFAAGGAADGCEMVDFDTFGMMPKLASHAKVYGEFFPFAVEAYMNWAEDVREHNYPEDKHGYHMDAAELEKFMNALEKF